MEIPQQEIMDMVNELYLETSKNVLSEKEYGIMRKLILEKKSISVLSMEYGVSDHHIKELYNEAFFRMKSASGLNALKENIISLQEEKINALENELSLFKKDIQDMIQYYDRKTKEILEYHPSKADKSDNVQNFFQNK